MANPDTFDAWWESNGYRYDPEAPEWVARAAWNARGSIAYVSGKAEVTAMRQERKEKPE